MRSLQGLVRALREFAEVRVVTTDADAGGRRLQEGEGREIGATYVPAWVWPDVTPRSFGACLRGARWADVVHVTAIFNASSAQAVAAGVAAGTPTIVSPRGSLQRTALGFRRPLAKALWLAGLGPLYRRVTTFHAASQSEAAAVQEVFGGRARTAVIPNGVDLPSADAVLRARHGTRRAIGFVGRIHPIKAIENLIEAYASLVDVKQMGPLIVAGPQDDVRYGEHLRRLASQLGVGDRVEFPGPIPEERLGEVYASFDVLVVPSHSENFSNVVVEALAWETPVVASLGTPWRLLEDARCGRWVSNDPGGLADAIRELVGNPTAAREAGNRGRRLVAERFTWAAVAAQMMSLYQGVSDPRSQGRSP